MDATSGTAMGWILVVAVAAFALAVLWAIFTGRINLEKLLSEADGKASLSRFQFLIFTFVLAGVYVAYCFGKNQLADIPNGWWQLLGISGGSYVVSKGIQLSQKP